MDILNAHVALGGDSGNTVPKYGITAAEAAVLRAIHGEEGLREIEVTGQAEVSLSDERERLITKYRARDEDGNFIVERLYPGANARLHETVEQLGVPDEFMKADRTPKKKPTKKVAAPAAPEDSLFE